MNTTYYPYTGRVPCTMVKQNCNRSQAIRGARYVIDFDPYEAYLLRHDGTNPWAVPGTTAPASGALSEQTACEI